MALLVKQSQSPPIGPSVLGPSEGRVLEQDDLRVAGEAGEPGGPEGPDAGVHLGHVGARAPGRVGAGRGGVACGRGQVRRRGGVRPRGLGGRPRAEDERRRGCRRSTEDDRRWGQGEKG